MEINDKFGELPDDASIARAKAALEKNGITALVAGNGAEARAKLFEIIPEGAEVMDMTSMTLEAIGVPAEINKGGDFKSVRNLLNQMDDKTQSAEKRRLGAAPEWAVGSAHAVTEDGEVLVASATGSQLPAYAYGAAKVVWVVGAQKIVKNVAEGLKRLYEYALPLEDERARKVYGMGSGVNKILIINKEFQPGRITIILVKEKLGF